MNPEEQRKINECISTLQVRGDQFTRTMLQERKRCSDLDEAIKKADAEIKRYRKQTKAAAVDVLNLHTMTANPAHSRADGLNPTRQADINQRKLVKTLEARLNKLLVRRSETANANQQLQEQINHFRKKRMVNDEVYKQLEGRLKEKQQCVADVMDQSAIASEHRERAVDARMQLQAMAQDEQDKFAGEYEDLGLYITQQNQLLEESIAEQAQEVAYNNANPGDVPDDMATQLGDLSIQQERSMSQKVNSLQSQMEIEREAMESVNLKLESFEKSFRKLKEVSGIDDLRELVHQFVKNEELTFSIFNYIQQLNQETDATQERHNKLEEEIKKYKADQEGEEAARRQVLQDLEDGNVVTQQTNKDNLLRVQDAHTAVERMSKKVQSLFFKIQCDQVNGSREVAAKSGGAAGGNKGSVAGARADSTLAMLAGQGVTESNILQYMGLIEQRAVDIISDYVKKMNNKDTGSFSPMSGPTRPMGSSWSFDQPIRPPEVSDDESDLEEGAVADGNAKVKPVSSQDMRLRAHEKQLLSKGKSGHGHGRKRGHHSQVKKVGGKQP